MRLFPVFLDLHGRACLVVGGGRVGTGKARALLDAGAAVTVVDPRPSPQLLELAAATPHLRVEARPFADDDCGARALVFACTADERVNAAVLDAASAHGAPACVSGSGGDDGDFSCGAILRRGDVCVAVSSGGASPALAAAARDRAASVVGDGFAVAASMLGALRARLQQDVADVRVRREAMRHAIDGGLLELLEAGHEAEGEALLAAVLEAALAEAGRSGSQGEVR